MINHVLDWLGADLRRWQSANAVMTTAVLALLDTARLTFGIIVVALVAFWSLRCGLRALRAANRLHPYTLVLALAPQGFALCLALGALWLAAQPGWLAAAMALFGGQLLAIVQWNNDLTEGRAQAVRVPAWMQEGA